MPANPALANIAPQQNLPGNPAAHIPGESEQEMEGDESEGEGEMEGEQEQEIDWEQVRQRILQDPSYANQFMQEIQHINPELYHAIQQNPQGMLEMLMSGEQPSEGHQPSTLNVTEEEKTSIERVFIFL